MTWQQVYEPLGNLPLSALLAALPVVVLLGLLAWFRVRVHLAALAGLGTALAVAAIFYGMPFPLLVSSAAFGAAYGLFPIGWIVIWAIFVYDITVRTGKFETLKHSISGLAADRRLQVLLVAFSFGAFIEGAAGFGTPVAISAAMLIGLGFRPLTAAGLSLIGNTAPVAYGALGTPIIALASVTGLPILDLSAMVGRQLPFFSVLVPFWLVWAFAGWRGMKEVWPACLTAGTSFAAAQFLMSNYHGPWLVDIVGSIASILALIVLFFVWQPRAGTADFAKETPAEAGSTPDGRATFYAWMPWGILSLMVFTWGLPPVKAALNRVFLFALEVPYLHRAVERVPPVVAAVRPEDAVFNFNLLSATGTSLLIAGLLSGLLLGLKPGELFRVLLGTLKRVRFSLVTIAAMLALGFTTRYAGLDATLGLAFASTGFLFPFFSPMLGWLGVALTGSDTSSNVLFGNLQQITAEQLGFSPVLASAANSSGGVMGKMIDAQSIVVASVATNQHGHEGDILRYVFFHSLALAALVGLLVLAQAYLAPWIVP